MRSYFILFSLFLLPFVAWSQFDKRQVLQEAFPGRQHYFGTSGDMDENRAVVTATHGRNPWAWSGGLAYVYQKKESGWELRNILHPEVSSDADRFGQNACAISGNWIIVGDWMNAQFEGGTAHIFQLSADTAWEHISSLVPEGTESYDHFGNRVAIDGNVAAVSTYKAVYVFEFTRGQWRQTAVLQGDQKKESGFGMSMPIRNNQIIVGSTWEDGEEFENLGALYVFKKEGKDWKKSQKIMAPKDKQEAGLNFGHSLDFDKKFLAVGCPTKDMGQAGSAGAVFLFRNKSGTWVYDRLLYNENFGYGIYGFGQQVSLSGDRIAVSENQDRDYQSSVFILDIRGKGFKTLAKIQETEGTAGIDYADGLLALSGTDLLVGDPGDEFCDDFSGSCGKAYFYNLSERPKTEMPKNSIEYAANWGFSESDIQAIRQKYKGDSILFDHINGDLVFKMSSRESGKWGMYQGDQEIIPAEYDSLAFFGWNHPFTIVKQNGKLGAYRSDFGEEGQLSVPCLYDDLHIYTHEGQIWLAAKRDGKWRWVNWYYGNEASIEFDFHQELYILENWNPAW